MDFTGNLTPGSIVHGHSTKRGASVTLSKRLNIKRGQEQVADQVPAAEYAKMVGRAPLSQGKAKTPAPMQRLGGRTAPPRKEGPALTIEAVERLNIPDFDFAAKRGSMRLAGKREPMLPGESGTGAPQRG